MSSNETLQKSVDLFALTYLNEIVEDIPSDVRLRMVAVIRDVLNHPDVKDSEASFQSSIEYILNKYEVKDVESNT